MKLPSINQNKPTSASSNGTKRPPKHYQSATTGSSLVENLEKNLFKKLQQFDEIAQIKPTKTNLMKENFMAQASHEDFGIDRFLRPQQSDVGISSKKTVENEIPVKKNSLQLVHEQEGKYEDQDFNKNNRINTRQPQNQQSRRKNNQVILGPRDLLMKPQKAAFLTGSMVESQQKAAFLTGSVVEQQDSDDDQMKNIEKRDKEKIEMKRMFQSLDDQDLNDVNNLISNTNIELRSHYSSLANLKNTIVTMNDSVKSLGFGVRQELIEQLESQYNDIMDIYKDDYVVGEYNQKARSPIIPNPKSKKASDRSSSLAQKPFKKKKKANDYSFSNISDHEKY